MKVFLSWSGAKSRKLAEVLNTWLPSVIQNVEPYYTPDDVQKGTRWNSEIAGELEECSIGILCLTRANLVAPWVMFEAGALSKKVDESRVCPLLFEVEPSDVIGPLVSLQATKFERDEMLRILRTINAELGDGGLKDNVLLNVFEKWWPDLSSEVESIMAQSDDESESSVRTEREILEEVLELTRSFTRRGQLRMHGSVSPAAVLELLHKYELALAKLAELGIVDLLGGEFLALQGPIDHVIRGSGARESPHYEEISRLQSNIKDICSQWRVDHDEDEKEVQVRVGEPLPQ